MPLSDVPFFQAQQQSPLGGTNWSGNTITTSYDPRLMQDFWAQVDQRQNQRNVYGTAAQNAYNAMTGPGADPRTGLPSLVAGVSPTPVQTGYSRAGFLAIPGANDFMGQGQRVEDSLFDRFASRADARFGREQTALENTLRDQGFVPGDEGYADALGVFNQGKNDAYQQAAREAVAGGGAESSRLLADALRIRAQQGSEAQQDLGNYNAAMGQNFGQRATAGQFTNQARGQGFGENVTSQQMPLQWLQVAQGGLPQGTMLPNFDLGLRGLDEPQANRNAWMAGLEGLLMPGLSAGLSNLLNGGNGSGGGSGPGLGGLLSSGANWLAGMFGGGGGDPAMDPSLAYGDESGWGADVIPSDWLSADWSQWADPSWLGDVWQ